jgi:hypothetical protein
VIPTWHAVDDAGRDLATGRVPRGAGAPTPAAAVIAVPVMEWPLAVVAEDGTRVAVAAVLGPGGDLVERLVSRLVAPADRPPSPRLAELTADTPAGHLDLPVEVVSLEEAAKAAREVEPAWVAAVAEKRSQPRRALHDAGRGEHLEAALHMAMLLAVEHLPATDGGVDVRAASGAQLWLLGGMVTSFLAYGPRQPFASWAELLGRGLWPIGPRGRALVVGDTRR